MSELDEIAIKRAIKESEINLINKFKDGGPFGAVIIKDGEIISSAHNTVLKSKDATAHAEINAIREASRKLNTHDLSGCILYTSAQPCPMCLSAIIWANIKEVFYANTKEEADDIGFRDDMIYEYIKGNNEEILKLHHMESEEALEVFKEFKKMGDENIY